LRPRWKRISHKPAATCFSFTRLNAADLLRDYEHDDGGVPEVRHWLQLVITTAGRETSSAAERVRAVLRSLQPVHAEQLREGSESVYDFC